jgi:hypothetical protein
MDESSLLFCKPGYDKIARHTTTSYNNRKMLMTDTLPDLEKAKVNLETSSIPWAELQRFFAAGLAIAVADELDLVEVAYQFSRDNKAQVEHWLNAGLIGHVTDRQAGEWIDANSSVWAVVVRPWVLVQASIYAPANNPG